ncbi:ubinuclein-1 isoform X2 [Anopheles coustani]|uniref:ubinuclein-1 isoform X2 n=1 Tax=Anopheles coustani TaxID=139045 RepID=UPI00265A404B|nr:ubinuclein-1 isoform X2 [Anopheles coustani]
MSDVKRVTLTTISDVVRKGGGGGTGGPFGALAFDSANAMSSAFGGGSSAFGGASHTPAGKESAGGSGGADGGKSGASGKKQKTVRLELNLFEPTAESFPEFNFSKLIHEEQKRLKKAQKKLHDDANNGFLSDPELDNDVARMARELERKYGSGTAYGGKEKNSRPSKLDYYDRGAGYDEEDSFIDNSEAYDELIPQEIETVGGGFYINSGQLEFKQLSNFERPDDVHRMPKPKKRALSTTSESSDEEDPPTNAKKKSEETPQPQAEKPVATPEPQRVGEEERTNAGGGNSGPEVGSGEDKQPRVNGHVTKKPKLADSGPKGAGLEKDKSKSTSGTNVVSAEKANGVKAKVAATCTQPAIGGPPAEVAAASCGGGGGSKKDENENDGGVKLIKTTTVKDMLRAKRDSLRKMEQEKKGRSSGSSRVSSSEAEEDGDGGADEDDEDEENDEDDDEDEEEEDDDDEGDGSGKESNESGSEEDIGSESASSHGSTSEKDPAAGQKVAVAPAVNGTDGETGQRPAVVALPEQKEKEQKERKRKECKLPDELPDSLRKVVEALKEVARSHAIGGKLNYFDSKVAEVLLQVDEEARAAGNSTRNAVFRHLEGQLSISRQSLQLKIKKIRTRKLEGRAKVALDQLQYAISDQMPLLLAKHVYDCQTVAEQRAAQAAAAAASANSTILPTGSDPASASNSEKPAPQTTNTPQIRNPKKKFPWNEKTRDLLWELYSIRVELFPLLRPRNETEDDFVAEYLRNKLVPLWPKGWIRYEDLHKELDRRKKALSKAPVSAVAKKHPPLVVIPSHATSSASNVIDPSWMSPGTVTAGVVMNGTAKSIGNSSSGGGGAGGSVGKQGSGSSVTTQPPHLSPNGNKRASSDHSISNIMNSPPLPPPPTTGEKQHSAANRSQTITTGRRSFDDDQIMLSPPKPVASGDKDSSSAKRGGPLAFPIEPRTSIGIAAGDLTSTNQRQRWSSREDDSDSSIEIIGEFNVIGGGSAGSASQNHSLPLAPTGVIHSAKSLLQSQPMVGGPAPSATAGVLPVLNKEKYKNLIAGKNKAHGAGGSSGGDGSSPIRSADTTPTGPPANKYSKHSPSVSDRIMQHGIPGSSLSFATPPPSGSVGSSGSRIKESPSTPSLDLDVHQIMKDLKEFQQHHNVGSNRKTDNSTIPPQQQHGKRTNDRPEKSKNGPIVVD